MNRQKLQLRLTIGTKLIGLIALLLICSVATIVYQSTEMYVRNDKENIRVSNVETTGNLANQMREIFSDLADKMRFMGTILWQDASPAAQNSPVLKEFFDKDKDLLGITVLKRNELGALAAVNHAFSQEFAAIDADGEKTLGTLYSQKSFSAQQLLKGEAQIISLKLTDGSPAIAVTIPLVQSETEPGTFSFVAVAFIRPAKFSKTFSENVRGSSFLVDRNGIVLAHSDATRVGDDFSQLPVVKEFLSGSKPQNMVPYADPATNESRLASYRVVGFAGMGVVAEVPEALAYQAATTMSRRSVFVGLIILFIAFWAGYMYSGTITTPIKKLVDAAQRIASGDFAIDLKARGKDEVAHLSRAFNEMARGLEERDRVKETFNKFHNKEIAEKLLSGEVKLGGERKEATIFFSDVRGFTAMSETMEPEQVVEMLNEYMTRMVAIVRKHHGIVDKYVGDAIMALWGVPLGGPDDTYNAVRACLEMREELAKLNDLRLSRGQNALKIGMGLNMGPVIAGNIGSTEKMEYTVIGDSVNLASRMESMTKEYGTDFLIPKAIFERVKDRFVFEQCKSAKVKGKSSAIEIFKVKGYIDETGREVVIETPYSTYESEKSDKVVHDEPAHAQETAGAPEVDGSSKLIEPTHSIDLTDERTNSGILREPTHSGFMIVPAPKPAAAPAPVAPPTLAQTEGYYVKMFGELMGPFTEAELRHGIEASEFPSDAMFSDKANGHWASVANFGKSAAPAPNGAPPAAPAQMPTFGFGAQAIAEKTAPKAPPAPPAPPAAPAARTERAPPPFRKNVA